MNCVPVLTWLRPTVFWGDDLGGDNRRFLEALDPGYYFYVAQKWARELLDSPELSKADRLRAGMALRGTHGQAVETLLALLAATAQAPSFPVGWMLRYRVSELESVVRAIEERKKFPSMLVVEPVTWDSLSTFVNSYLPTPELRETMIPRFAQLWRRLARGFLKEEIRQEYNSLKHGLRNMPGGFSVAVGVEKALGQPAPTEEMKSLGGAEFGSSFYRPVPIPGADNHDIALAHQSRNWQPEALILDLQLVALSVGNVVSCLRIAAGAAPETVRFAWPHEDEAFDKHFEFRVSLESFSMGSRLTVADIRPVTKADVQRHYKESRETSRPRNGAP